MEQVFPTVAWQLYGMYCRRVLLLLQNPLPGFLTRGTVFWGRLLSQFLFVVPNWSLLQLSPKDIWIWEAVNNPGNSPSHHFSCPDVPVQSAFFHLPFGVIEESHQDAHEAEDKNKRNVQDNTSIGVSERNARKCIVSSLELANLKNYGRLRALKVVSICLEPGPGMIKVKESCLLSHTSQIEESALVWVVCISGP